MLALLWAWRAAIRFCMKLDRAWDTSVVSEVLSLEEALALLVELSVVLEEELLLAICCRAFMMASTRPPPGGGGG